MQPPEAQASPLRTAAVAGLACLVCSLLVSTTAVLLRPLQAANRQRERERRILEIVSREPALAELFAAHGEAAVEARVVELDTGAFADWIDPAELDGRDAALDPLASIALPPERDPAGIGRRARFETVYLARSAGRVELVILPVHGQGYASTIRGYVALSGDGETVRALTFYEHAETPGLGAEIEDPDWLASWAGKRVRDDAGRLRLGVAADDVYADSPEYPYMVDALTGATKTGDGVTRLLRFWLGEDGFAPFLRRLGP